jgi:hypothetical protein
MVGAGAAACTAQALVLDVLISGLCAVGFLTVCRSGLASMPYGPGSLRRRAGRAVLMLSGGQGPCVGSGVGLFSHDGNTQAPGKMSSTETDQLASAGSASVRALRQPAAFTELSDGKLRAAHNLA